MARPFKTYRARRQAEARYITRALESSGAQILEAADGRTAPLEYAILTPRGERLHLLCYAFEANKYAQKNRPKDEHRFQIKYGSDFDRYHDIFIAEGPGR